MEDFRFVQAGVLELLNDLTKLPGDVKESLRDNIQAGEPELTFDAICTWIADEELEISPQYYAKLVAMAHMLDWDKLEIQRLAQYITR